MQSPEIFQHGGLAEGRGLVKLKKSALVSILIPARPMARQPARKPAEVPETKNQPFLARASKMGAYLSAKSRCAKYEAIPDLWRIAPVPISVGDRMRSWPGRCRCRRTSTPGTVRPDLAIRWSCPNRPRPVRGPNRAAAGSVVLDTATPVADELAVATMDLLMVEPRPVPDAETLMPEVGPEEVVGTLVLQAKFLDHVQSVGTGLFSFICGSLVRHLNTIFNALDLDRLSTIRVDHRDHRIV